MEISIRITNLSQIRKAFAASPVIMTKNLNKAIRRVVISIQRDSVLGTPVDTGRLRSSHYTRFQPLKGEVGTNTLYDRFVHEGTRFMKARPYMKKAVDKNKSFVDREFKAAVQDTLNEIARKSG